MKNLDSYEKEIDKNIINALKKHDENTLKEQIIKLMEYFLRGKSDVYDVDSIASHYITAEYFYEECKDFEIKDKVLRNVYEELSAVEQYDLDKAKERVKKLLNSLESTPRWNG